LNAIEKNAPAGLAQQARERGQSKDTLFPPLLALWADESADYLSRALLRPYLEALRELSLTPDRARGAGCGFCGGPPWVSVRRASGDADGAARFLCCALCGSEKPYPRIRCPGCGEQDPTKLPSYQSDEYPEARIEACESCRRYLKSIDLSLDARPVAEVDELRSIGMDLWALEQGFIRMEPGIAGV
jgi:FdhE protein